MSVKALSHKRYYLRLKENAYISQLALQYSIHDHFQEVKQYPPHLAMHKPRDATCYKLNIATWTHLYAASTQTALQIGHWQPEHMHVFVSCHTPWCRVLLEKLTGLQLVKKFPAFHGTRRPITALTSVRHLSLSWASPIQSIYTHPTSWRSILISAHLRLGPPVVSFPPVSPPRPYTLPSPHPYAPHAQLTYLLTYSLHGAESFLRS